MDNEGYQKLFELKTHISKENDTNKEIQQTLINLLKWKNIEVEFLKKYIKKDDFKEESDLYKEIANSKSKEKILMQKFES